MLWEASKLKRERFRVVMYKIALFPLYLWPSLNPSNSHLFQLHYAHPSLTLVSSRLISLAPFVHRSEEYHLAIPTLILGVFTIQARSCLIQTCVASLEQPHALPSAQRAALSLAKGLSRMTAGKACGNPKVVHFG